MKKGVWPIIVVIGIIILVALAIGFGKSKTPDNTNPNTVLAPQSGLPTAVATTRENIAKATDSQDYKTLAALTDPKEFRYSFGKQTPGGFASSMETIDKQYGKNTFLLIKKLLSLPYDKQGDIYVWPAVFTKSSDKWTQEDIDMMKQIASDQEIEGYRQFGAYIGYRVGIREDGKWIYYLAGD